jgi:hypothetical protein
MASHPRVIVQLPRDGAADRQVRREPAASVARGDVAVVALPADAEGRLGPPDAGEIVMSVLAPEALVHEQEELRRVLHGAGQGAEPLVVVVEAAQELREDELGALLDAARHSRRDVILRIVGDG